MSTNREQQAGIERRAFTRFGRTLTASQMSREHVEGYLRFGTPDAMDLALEAMFLLDARQIEEMDRHEAWSEAEADLRADQSASAREAFS